MYTKFGKTRIDNTGYYRISSGKEGNNGKLLHRLIWEDHYSKPVPKGYVIHHLNGNRLDNRIQNLQCVPKEVHDKFHRKMDDRNGENNPFYNKNHTLESNLQHSLKANTTGYFRVTTDRTRQGKLQYVYRYYENFKPKKLKSISLEVLEQKVRAKGLEWIKLSDLEE